MAGRTAGPIKTILGMKTHVDPGSVLGKVKVKVMSRHLANANKTPHRGRIRARCAQRPARAERIRARSVINTADRNLQGRDNRARSAINLRPEDGYLQLVSNKISNVSCGVCLYVYDACV